MGPASASEVLRESLYRGADAVILLSDRHFAAADTLATSYTLSKAIRKIGEYDFIFCGRQAIDGDTAQVGPQLAEKLGVPQITYIEDLRELNGRTITARRNIGNGWQQVKTALPVLLTVIGEANEPRVAAAKKIMKFKNARTPFEVEQKIKAENQHADEATLKELWQQKCAELQKKGLLIKVWDLDFLGTNLKWCGRNGSPTKVHRIQSVILAAKESKTIEPTDNGTADMIHELIEDKIIA